MLYNIYVSPLKKVPGPLINLIFPIIHDAYLLGGTYPEYCLDMHNKYGNVVRLSWNQVSFSSESAAKELYATYGYQKSNIYEILSVVGETTFSTRNKDFHRQRKKIIAPCFSDKVIGSVEYLVKKNLDNFVSKINEFVTQDQKLDFGLYFHYFAFDVIGDLAFGKSFNMLKDGHHPIVDWVKDLSKIGALVFTFPFMKYYQFKTVKKLYEFSYDAIRNTRSNPGKTTILGALIEAADPETGKKLNEKELAEESILQLAAGTDTTSHSLTWLFYLLSNHPEIYQNVKDEMLKIFPNKQTITYNICKLECHYLNAVIHEGLRIVPAIGGTPTRLVPKGGKIIDEYYIPEGCTVGTNINALHNLSIVWKDPEAFNPKRWLKNGKFKNNSNFMPFSMGPRGCIGRQLAWMELYLVSATLIRNFTFKRESSRPIDRKSFITTQPAEAIKVSIIKH
ncbi:cytochrome P450 [Neoconidiobolus thromboides FSU 785]|nr:cytochrome P450 [Neoconidiobolus thromboides FSU 785]